MKALMSTFFHSCKVCRVGDIFLVVKFLVVELLLEIISLRSHADYGRIGPSRLSISLLSSIEFNI